MERLKLATIWLGGCSGCHMSFLDLDEWLIELATFADIVYSPVVDFKVYPEEVDAVLVEGAVSTDENLAFIREVRERTKIVIAFGDCAVTGNVTSLRNPIGGPPAVLTRAYRELVDRQAELQHDDGILPILLPQVQPVHKVVNVDYFMPGCPPPADRIRTTLEALIAGRPPTLEGCAIKFG
jgi:NAD-reducing hydrogenase small subunit